MREFDILSTPLTGTHLIEASAGTGKTYAIAGLFLRLILEGRLSPGDILVVTFTNAATAELRDRVRAKIRDCLSFLSGERISDKVIEGLAEGVANRKEASMRLRSALQGFDEASIHTIHGFCGRILRENPFESGTLFDTRMVTDQDELVMEVIRDFWRIHLSEESLLFLSYARGRIGIEGLSSFYRSFCNLPVAVVVPACDKPDTKDLERLFHEAFNKAASFWKDCRDEVSALLSGFEGLNRRSYPAGKMEGLIRDMDRFLSGELLGISLFPSAHKFGLDYIRSSTRKGFSPPGHAFFKVWDELMELKANLERAFEDSVMAVQRRFFEYAGGELLKRKAAGNIAYFDDLLTGLQRALQGEGGERLAGAVAGRFKAALIDEFQDTDPVQYEIFKKVFSRDDRALFLIGDPKQAIYGFRGADIFTYMRASRDLTAKSTLTENWRSHPLLIKAVNALFGLCDRPFVFDEIPFRAAQAAKGKKHDELIIDGMSPEPFSIWYLEREGENASGDYLNKADASKIIVSSVSSEIARLILLGRRGKAFIGGRPLVENDIAVLVRKNFEADMIKAALSRLGVPAVLNQTGSVFATDEASEMERLLNAIARPGNIGALKAALASGMLGLKAEDLDGPGESGDFLDAWISVFRGYGEIWASRGFISMFRGFMAENHVIERLASLPDGERRATNILHLAELLHKASLEQGRGVNGLISWLTEKRGSDLTASDEYQLRLESDERAVKIVTVHRSKGLQYPVVFCPFMWAATPSAGKKGPPALFHNENGTMVLDIGSGEIEKNLDEAKKEALAEDLRVLYVALTRACNRCYLVWASNGGKAQSALDFLVSGTGGGPFLGPSAEPAMSMPGGTDKVTSDTSIPARLRALAQSAAGAIKVETIPEGASYHVGRSEAPRHLFCRSFGGLSYNYPRIASFTALTGYDSGSEGPGYDEAAGQEELEGSIETDEQSSSGLEPVYQTMELSGGATHDYPQQAGSGLREAAEREGGPGASEILRGSELPGLDRPALPRLDSYAASADTMGIEQFPRGERAGVLLHDILESIDFAPEAAEKRMIVVRNRLRAHGFEPLWEVILCELIERALDKPLPCREGEIRLSTVRMKERVSEMEFCFPLGAISPQSLAGAVAPFAGRRDYGSAKKEKTMWSLPADFPERVANLGFSKIRGFMKGAVDLVFRSEGRFYLLDWKSNYLGEGPLSYGREALEGAMSEHHYHLQYLIYLAALHRFLQLRLPGYGYDRHFGCVFYVFLRGLSSETGGVYRTRPPAELLDRLCNLMMNRT